MRQFILITAMLLMSASAQAEQPRGLSSATNNGTTAIAQSKTADASNADVSRTADPSPAGGTASSQQQGGQDKLDQPSSAQVDKPAQVKPVVRKTDKQRRDDLETRVIDGLHRHGIYW